MLNRKASRVLDSSHRRGMTWASNSGSIRYRRYYAQRAVLAHGLSQILHKDCAIWLDAVGKKCSYDHNVHRVPREEADDPALRPMT